MFNQFYCESELLQPTSLIPGYRHLTRSQIIDQAGAGVDQSTALDCRRRELRESFSTAISEARQRGQNLADLADYADDDTAKLLLIFSIRAFDIAARLSRILRRELSLLEDKQPSHHRVSQEQIEAANGMSCADVLADRGWQIHRGRIDCPFCDGGSGGSGVVLNSGRYYCHRCQASHNAITLVRALDGVGFLDAVKSLTA